MGGGAFHSLRWSFLTLSVPAVARPATNRPPGAPGGLEAGSFSPIFCPLHLCTFCTLLVTGLSQSRDCHPGGQWGKYSHYRMILYLETEKIIPLFSYYKLNTNQNLHTYTHTHSRSGQRGGHRRLLLRAGGGGRLQCIHFPLVEAENSSMGCKLAHTAFGFRHATCSW